MSCLGLLRISIVPLAIADFVVLSEFPFEDVPITGVSP